jgi:hypothetical protein
VRTHCPNAGSGGDRRMYGTWYSSLSGNWTYDGNVGGGEISGPSVAYNPISQTLWVVGLAGNPSTVWFTSQHKSDLNWPVWGNTGISATASPAVGIANDGSMIISGNIGGVPGWRNHASPRKPESCSQSVPSQRLTSHPSQVREGWGSRYLRTTAPSLQRFQCGSGFLCRRWRFL